MNRNQLFVISREARESLSPPEVRATIEGLKKLNLYALPYPKVDIWVAADNFLTTDVDNLPLIEGQKETKIHSLIKDGLMIERNGKAWGNFGDGHWLELRNVSLEDPIIHAYITFYKNRHIRDVSICIDHLRHSDFQTIVDGLIVLLATRNVVKDVRHRPAAKLGIGVKKDRMKAYEYVTTISVPRDRDDDEGPGAPTGASRAPHLRRGHIRHQRFGPNLEFARLIWIAPIFVNADKGWVLQRERYNLGSGAHAPEGSHT